MILSRRNIRIKVMQLLYALGRDEQLTFSDVLRRYEFNLKKSMELYLYNLLEMVEVAHFSVEDFNKRQSKLLPQEEDKLFTPKLYKNSLIQDLIHSDTWKQAIAKYKLEGRIDRDQTRLLYQEFSKNETYKAYVLAPETSFEDHQKKLLELYKFCNSNEIFDDLMEDLHASWIDDKSLVVGATKKTIKALPSLAELYTTFGEEDQYTIEFGEALLTKTNEHDEELLSHIEPMLKNWDAERVAILDMILLKMAVCELMFFPTIPTKVTLNEFVEISKMYSTDKSKDFINGLLDRLMKKLQKDGKIKKEGRGLIE